MNQCFFCGLTENPLTEEHVWPKWVSKLLFGQYNSTHFIHVRSQGDNTTGLWNSRYLQVTTDNVCDQCNNVWLSNFENNEVKPLATPLILGNQEVIIKPLEQWTLAAWAFKMALLLEIAAKENPQPFFTAAERKQFRETKIPSEKVRVFMANYEYGQHPAHAAIPLHTLTRREDQQPFHLKISTITAGCLAMQVMSVRSRTSGELVYAGSEMDFVFEGKGLDAIVPIWPPTGQGVRWPPKETLSQENLEAWTNMWETAKGLNRLPPDAEP
jgi:hypothetical protein